MTFNHDERGFTLLETLVAFLIAGLALTVLLSGHRLALDGGSRAEAKLSLTLEAQNVLAAAGALYDLRPGTTEGTQNGFRWRVEIEPFGEASASPVVVRVRATVRRGARSATVETLRLAGPVR